MATTTGVSILKVKKGARIRLRSGWCATVLDNRCRQHTRLCDVEGLYREIGSVYTTNILQVERDGQWLMVEHTPAQLKTRAARQADWWAAVDRMS